MKKIIFLFLLQVYLSLVIHAKDFEVERKVRCITYSFSSINLCHGRGGGGGGGLRENKLNKQTLDASKELFRLNSMMLVTCGKRF